jgi:antitoxin CcdA
MMPAQNRRAANLSIDPGLLDEGRALKINLSRAAEAGIAKAIAIEKTRKWAEENADVIRGSNKYVEKFGLPLEKYRLF